MSKTTYAGVPREKIPWYPIIDYSKCDLCGGNPKCKEFCMHDVFDVAEEEGRKKLVVAKPYNCVVFCTACEKICPIPGTITFPSKTEVSRLITNYERRCGGGGE
jgi:NAD-dependent dihydropyrimidine dehydrogenase PreA subunit